jgi:predicted outer membrane repeat protein
MKTIYFILVFLILSTFLAATIINVPDDQPTIQEGINEAVDSDTVLVQPDTYIENINYNGKNITVASLFLTTQDTTYISQTVIDGSQPSNPDSASVVTFCSGEDSSSVLIGFTITGGSGTLLESWFCGGGIICIYNSSPTITNNTITSNTAAYAGGGIVSVYGSFPTITDNIITGNAADSVGGGICFRESLPTITHNTIEGNTAPYGGGIACDSSSSGIIDNCTISGNSAVDEGGGIYCIDNCNLIITNCTINENGAGYRSGGIYCIDNCNLSLENVTVSQNTAGEDGGGIYSKYSDLQIENCDFTGNTAQDGFGGAIDYWNYGDPQYADETYQIVITNSQFSNNTASGDGGVCIGKTDDDLSIINVTIDGCEFVDNIADSYGGLYLRGNMLTFSILNSIFTGNEAINYVAGCCFTHYCTGEMINCLFASNTAATAGGYCNSGGISVWTGTNVDLVNCTLVDNSAAYGAGLTVGSGGTATITNCLFWGNSYDQIALIDYNDQGGTLFVDYCDVQDGIDSVSVSSFSTFAYLGW